MSVNLGPVAPTLDGVEPNGDGRGYNPRCLRRDVSSFAAQWSKTSDTAWLIAENHDIYWFQTMMQGQFEKGYLGVHTAGHYTIGGDPGGVRFSLFPTP
jgi:tyrosinase